MFKATDRIYKAIDQVKKSIEGIESEERKQQALKVIHEMSVLHSNCLHDLTDRTV